jgi:hypothetical protein
MLTTTENINKNRALTSKLNLSLTETVVRPPISYKVKVRCQIDVGGVPYPSTLFHSFMEMGAILGLKAKKNRT